MECATNTNVDDASETALCEDITLRDGSETPRKKNKKHKKHKSKKKRKKRKGDKESSSESGVESDGESQTKLNTKKEGSSSIETRGHDEDKETKNSVADKDQLLEIAKANAAAMCAKAGMPIPESLKPKAILQLPLPTPTPAPLSLPLPLPVPSLPLNLPMGLPAMPNMPMNAAMASMTAATMTAALSNMGALAAMPPMPPLPTITNKPPPAPTPNLANIEEVKRKVAQQANSISIKELTEKCKQIAESKEEMSIARPHFSDDDDDGNR
ncbi:hypothetical protein NFI96_033820 [Prochilodus magdalenae]|nr:hypothetical protein NFI96_033820 [Prochilodus magdalenae]